MCARPRSGASPAVRRVAVEDGAFTVETAGDGPDALLMHGGPGLEDYLAPLADLLAGVIRTHRYTMRGLAPSPTAGPFTVGRHVQDAVEILDGLGLGRAIVIGHSWGGFVAAAFARLQPDRVAALVLLDSTGLTGDGGIEAFGRHFRLSYSPGERERIEQLDWLAARRALTAAESSEYERIDWPYYHADPAAPPPFLARRFSPDAGRDGITDTRRLLTEDFFAPLGRCRIPTLVVGGAKGPFPRSVFEDIAGLIPGSRLVLLARAGHYPWYEQPEHLRDAIAAFVRSNLPG